MTTPRDAFRNDLVHPSMKSAGSTMTEPAPAVTVTIQNDSCPVCPHPTGNHDSLGRRYCAATAAGTLDRGCICANRTPAT